MVVLSSNFWDVGAMWVSAVSVLTVATSSCASTPLDSESMSIVTDPMCAKAGSSQAVAACAALTDQWLHLAPQKRRPLWMETRDDLPHDFFQTWLADAAEALQMVADLAPKDAPIAWHTQHYPLVSSVRLGERRPAVSCSACSLCASMLTLV